MHQTVINPTNEIRISLPPSSLLGALADGAAMFCGACAPLFFLKTFFKLFFRVYFVIKYVTINVVNTVWSVLCVALLTLAGVQRYGR